MIEAAIALMIGSLATASAAQSCPLSRVSLTSAGQQATHQSREPAISANGRVVTFNTESALVPTDTNGVRDIYAVDLDTGALEQVSVDSNGAGGSHGSLSYSDLSADGRFVAFVSASEFGPPLSPPGVRAFVRDRALGTTVVAAASSSGQEALGVTFCGLSDDGRYLFFSSQENFLAPLDNNGEFDVFVRDLQTGATELVSRALNGFSGNQISGGFFRNSDISGDGRFVVFCSAASNLVVADTNNCEDVFVRDRSLGWTERVSVGSNGQQANHHSFGWTSISSDGRYVAFMSFASNLDVSDSNGVEDCFVRDRWSGVTACISRGVSGVAAAGASGFPQLSADGRFVAFSSSANDLTAGDANGHSDAFLFDRLSGAMTLLSVNAVGAQGDSFSFLPMPSGGARTVAFLSRATNLASGDTNGVTDLFILRCPAVQSYCTSGVSSLGCVATISALGTPSLSAGGGFTLRADGVNAQRSGLIFYGVGQRQALPISGSSSWFCIRPPVQRTFLGFSGGSAACDGALTIDWLVYISSHAGALGQPFGVGALVQAQAWYRDASAPIATSAFSNALEFVVEP